MIKFYLPILISIICGGHGFSQNIMFTPEEEGRMFHVVMKSPILKRNLSQHFEYKGPKEYFHYEDKKGKDSLIDYDSIVSHITLEPKYLNINYYNLGQSSTGLLSELASQMALYKLYEELKNRKIIKPEGIEEDAYQYFLDTLTLKLPNNLIRRKNGVDVPSKGVIDFINPNYFFNQKVKQVKTFQSIEQVEHKKVMDAINYATRSYIQIKGNEYYSKFAKHKNYFITNLIACGDGSNTDGLLSEREKIYKHKNELGDPIGVGLFTYESQFHTNNGNRQVLKPEQSTQVTFEAIPKNYTNVHFSMWGFNRNQQTTVALYREDKMYLLYANKLTKELSPDSTFGKGSTIFSLIKQLEEKAIPDQDELLNGKDGLRSKLDNRDTVYKDVMMEIVATEMKLSNLRYNGLKNRKKTKKSQKHLVWLYDRKSTIENQQKDLLGQIKDGETRMAKFIDRLFELKGYINFEEMEFNNFGYIYTFEDGCTFNANTQNFVFPDSLSIEDFNVRLITFGPNALAEHVDEIQLLSSISKGTPEDFSTHPVELSLQDIFDSDQFKIKDFKFSQKQRFELSKLLYTTLTQDKELIFNLNGNGPGVLMEGKVVGTKIKELEQYPGETKEERKSNRESLEFKPLRVSYVNFNVSDSKLQLNIESFTDPVKSNFTYRNSGVKDLKDQYDSITDNHLLSAFRTFYISELFCKEMIYAVSNDFGNKEKNKIIGDIKSKLYKSKVSMGPVQLRYSDYVKVAHPNTDFYEMVTEELENKEKERLKVLGIEEKKK